MPSKREPQPKKPIPAGTVWFPRGATEETEAAIMEFLQGYINLHGFSPTIREIGDHINRTHPTVLRHLAALEEKGYIRSAPKHRVITIVND